MQTSVIKAAKIAGVKRFIPCDWGTACVPGVRYLFDQVCNSSHISIKVSNLEEFVSMKKSKYHDLIKELGLDYTFIDVGWWYA